MAQHTLTFSWSNGGLPLKASRTLTADVEANLDLPVPKSTANLPAAFSLVLAKAEEIVIQSDQPLTLTAGGVNAVQTLSTPGPPTAGTFTITCLAQTTAAIVFNATAAQVQAALSALSSVGVGGVVCTGGPLPGTPVVITFTGPLATQTVATITHTDTLTGGAAVAASTVTGVAPDTTIALKAGVPLIWTPGGYFAQPFAADVSMLRVTNASNIPASLKIRTLSDS